MIRLAESRQATVTTPLAEPPKMRRPRRALQIVWNMDQGGIESSLMQLLRSLDPQSFRLDFLVEKSLPSALEGEINSRGSKVICCAPPGRPVAFAREFRRVLGEHGPYDIVHSHRHFSGAYVLALAALFGVKRRIAHSHSDTRARQVSASWLQRMGYSTMRWLTLRTMTTGLAVSSDAALALFGGGWPGDSRIRVVPSAIDFSEYVPSLRRRETRQELGIPEDAFVVGHVGRFVEAKNHPFLLPITEELLQRNPKTRLLLVGDGLGRKEIETKARAMGLLDVIHMAGHRADIPALFASMDAFVLPSVREGLPRVLVEAQAAGLPCIVSDVVTREADIVPCLVRRLSLNEDPATWAAAIANAVTHDLPQPGEALALCRASKFNIDTLITGLTTLYST